MVSFIQDKVPCKGHCELLFDPDQLNDNGVCRDCVLDDDMTEENRLAALDEEELEMHREAADRYYGHLFDE